MGAIQGAKGLRGVRDLVELMTSQLNSEDDFPLELPNTEKDGGRRSFCEVERGTTDLGIKPAGSRTGQGQGYPLDVAIFGVLYR